MNTDQKNELLKQLREHLEYASHYAINAELNEYELREYKTLKQTVQWFKITTSDGTEFGFRMTKNI